MVGWARFGAQIGAVEKRDGDDDEEPRDGGPEEVGGRLMAEREVRDDDGAGDRGGPEREEPEAEMGNAGLRFGEVG